jgi:adenylate cyclase
VAKAGWPGARGESIQAQALAASVESGLTNAERRGFRLAVVGRTCALIAIACFYLEVFRYPNNVFAAVGILSTAALGLVSLSLVGGRYERAARYVLFTLDAASASAILALAPLSSGGDIPQNLVFLSRACPQLGLLGRGHFWFRGGQR